MNKISYKLYKFMQGRYGIDDLYKFLLYCYIIILFIDLFVNFKLLSIIELILVIYIFYRVFSKNISKRKQENYQYLKIKNKIKSYISFQKKKWDERDTKFYKKCPKCKTILKLPLPSKRGLKHITCPKCQKRMIVLCLRHEKIEIIVNKKKK